MIQIGNRVHWLKAAKHGGKEAVPVTFLGYVGKTGKYVAIRVSLQEKRVLAKSIRELAQKAE